MTAFLAGIGTAVPPNTLDAGEWADLAARLMARVPREAALLHAVARRSGVARRHLAIADPGGRSAFFEDRPPGAPPRPTTAERMAAYRLHAPPLAEQAARRALDEAGLSPADATHLVVVSCTGFHSPGVDLELIERLGLSPAVQRTVVGFMGCHGAVNGGRVAAAICGADPSAVVLVVCIELCSLHLQASLDRDAVAPNSLFGDGAAAMAFHSVESPKALRWRRSASIVLPDSRDAMSWTIGDEGFSMTLDSRVPDLIRASIRPWIEGVLAADSNSMESVESWAIHPGGPRILDSALAGLGLPREAGDASREVLRNYGNLSSATVLFIAKQLIDQGAPRSIALLAFGPGLSAEFALIDSGASAE